MIHAETLKCGVSTNQIATKKTFKKSVLNFVRFVKVSRFKSPIINSKVNISIETSNYPFFYT